MSSLSSLQRLVETTVKEVVEEQISPKSLKAFGTLQKSTPTKSKANKVPFNLKTFKSLDSLEAMKDYLEFNTSDTKYLGEGSSRVVYGVGPHLAIKLAHPGFYTEKGQAQNKAEVQSELYALGRYIAEPIDYDRKEYNWVIVERAERMFAEDFSRLTGFDFDEFVEMLIEFQDHWNFDLKKVKEVAASPSAPYNSKIARWILKLLKTNKWFVGLVKCMKAGDIRATDLERLDQWGIVRDSKGEHPVLVDYGFNTEVMDTHYRESAFAGKLGMDEQPSPKALKAYGALEKQKKLKKGTFSLKTLKELTKNKHVVTANVLKYVEETCSYLGEGSSRVVYSINNNLVIKVAQSLVNDYYNDDYEKDESAYNAGRAQNKAEVQAELFTLGRYVAEIIDYDRYNYTWLIVERAYPMYAEDFQKSTGLDFNSTLLGLQAFEFFKYNLKALVTAAQKANKLNKPVRIDRDGWESIDPQEILAFVKLLKSNKWLSGLVKVLQSGEIRTTDLQREDQWGIVKDATGSHPVLVDYGYNKDVGREHYGHNITEQASLKALKAYDTLEKKPLVARPKQNDKKEYQQGPFNLQEFKSIPKLPGYLRRYLDTRTNCQLVGKGSSRAAYAIGPNLVVKIAVPKNGAGSPAAGQAQNKAETQSNLFALGRYVAEIIDYDHEKFTWLIVERARGISDDTFEKLTGIDFNALMQSITELEQHDFDLKALVQEYGPRGGEPWPEMIEFVKLALKNKWVAGFVKFLRAGDLRSNDLWDLSNQWGVVTDEEGQHPVLVDYGFNTDVKVGHYSEAVNNDSMDEQASPQALKAYGALDKPKKVKSPATARRKGPFNIKDFKALQTEKGEYLPGDLYDYIETCTDVEFLGRGSSRMVYSLGKHLVIKAATGVSGRAQNKAEVQGQLFVLGRYVAEVIDYDHKNYSWLIVEKAEPMSIEDFTRLTGLDFDTCMMYLEHFQQYDFDIEKMKTHDVEALGRSYIPKEAKRIEKLLKTHKWFAGLAKVLQAGDLQMADLINEKQWGIVTDKKGQHPVIVDYGFNMDVGKKHYDFDPAEYYRERDED